MSAGAWVGGASPCWPCSASGLRGPSKRICLTPSPTRRPCSLAGYTLLEGNTTCTACAVEGCKDCSEGIDECYECLDGLGLADGKCEACPDLPNCTQCDTMDATKVRAWGEVGARGGRDAVPHAGARISASLAAPTAAPLPSPRASMRAVLDLRGRLLARR